MIDTGKSDGTCEKYRNEVSECARKLHASELDKLKVKRDLQSVQGQLDTCNKKECPKAEALPCEPVEEKKKKPEPEPKQETTADK